MAVVDNLPDTTARIETMDKIAQLWLRGNSNPTAIAKQLGMRRVDVLDYIQQYREVNRNNDEVRARAVEALHEADARLNMVLQKFWEVVEQADEADDLRTKNSALKNLADTEMKRVEMLEKAGLYDDAALGDEMAALEENMEVLKKIISEVSGRCPNCKFEVAKRLARVTGKVEDVHPDDVISGEVIG